MSKLLRNALIAALLLHICSAFLSLGFYHSDEHFQILEFLNYKLGLSPSSALPIEFGERIRPWLQVGLYRILISPMIWLGDSNPFHWALLIRLFSSFIGWLSLCGLAGLALKWVENPKLQRVAIILCAALWFLPGLHARHSSENLSGSVFYLTLSVLFLTRQRVQRMALFKQLGVALALGLCFGASFEFRYQVGFLIAGIYFYWLIFFRKQWAFLSAMFIGTLAMVAIGVLLDHWGYGAWTFAPWNYFHYNLILNHVSDVDTHPIWDFFRSSSTETFPPLGPILLTACVLGWIAKPKSPLTWATLPLFLVHTAIGHKELRFLFPIAQAAPLLSVQFLDTQSRSSQACLRFLEHGLGLVLVRFLFAINLLALIASTFIPVWMPARFFQQLYPIAVTERFDDGGYAKFTIFYQNKNPFDILGLPLNFYRPPLLSTQALTSWSALQHEIDSSPEPIWYFQVADQIPETETAIAHECHLQIGSLPQWIMHIIRTPWLSHFTHRVTNWTLYRCAKA